MAWIRTIDPDEADGPLAAEYRAAQQRAGRLWHILRLQSLNPAALRASVALYRALLFGESPLSRGQRELLAVVVSQTNGCRY
jgi:alkylhydroperoxidase family enzyme